ncbi:hypothetical protein HJC23_004188 [Cyclotella cryptica]|uniref:MYND-type domain-containing protein n=1 Tax=Cyclotella cryptica TaxID=29204 RepID=A0ABD3Q8X4_9STRA|eukprot:CCRYP_007814-RA/>CCRYP_007814-RA protein AED:0.00 eAED:0.00 QI:157/-1/1/1/-1/1/1/217/431
MSNDHVNDDVRPGNQTPPFTNCHNCYNPSSSVVAIKACTGCFTVGYCSKSCQKSDWPVHKSSCHRRRRHIVDDGVSSSGIHSCFTGGSEGIVRLEVKMVDSNEWRDAGPIDLIDDVATLNLSSTQRSVLNAPTKSGPNQHPTLTKELPSDLTSLLGSQSYRYRHSADGIDNNILLLFHGAGDTLTPYDALAQQMALPQTSTLAVSASHVQIPFDLGYTWFEEMDCFGNTLANDDPRRLNSLRRVVDWLEDLLCLLTGIDPNNSGSSGKSSCQKTDSETSWIPERVFLLGFSAGACLIMELCRSWWSKGRSSLGGAICVAGGIRTSSLSISNKACDNSIKCNKDGTDPETRNEATDILILAGSNDDVYSPKSAEKSKQLYSFPSKVRLHIQEKHGHTMIRSKREMTVVMEFLSQRLARRTVSMEKMAQSFVL